MGNPRSVQKKSRGTDTELHAAARAGNLRAVESICNSDPLAVNSRDQHSRTPYPSSFPSGQSSPTTVPARLKFIEHFMTESAMLVKEGDSSTRVRPLITFVLGGPGSGKGTQCAKIAETFGFLHLSAGELLRKEILSGGENGSMILDIIKEGKIVPSEITVNLIRREIELSENRKVLIDGFPRTDENRIAFERIVGVGPDLVIFFDCPEEEMVKRLLSRNQGRIDDNIETIKKRLEIFDKLNLPVINYYSSKGKVHKVKAVGTTEEIFEKVNPIFASLSL